MSSKSIYDKILSLVNKKRIEDPNGLQKARNQGPQGLLNYLSADLRKSGVDPTKILTEDLLRCYSAISTDSEETIMKISNLLDEILFEPYFSKNATSFDKNILAMSPDFRRFEFLNSKLRIYKVMSCILGILCIGAALSAFIGRNLISMGIYGLFALDLFRISYNCYIKTYVCLAMTKLGGNVSRAGETFFQWMSAATGLLPNKDPFNIVKNEISFEILVMNTWVKIFYFRTMDALSNSKKNK